MNRNLISFTAAILLLAACREQENKDKLKELDESIETAVKEFTYYIADPK